MKKECVIVGFCSIALRNSPVEQAVEEISQAGFSAIELWYSHIEGKNVADLLCLRDIWAKMGVHISVLSPYFSFTRGKENWLKSISTAENVVAAAQVLGVKKIRTFIDVGPDGLPSSRANRSDWENACEGLRKLCALDRTIEFIIETHENTLADTLDSTRMLIDRAGEPNLKINYQATEDFMKRGYLECLEELWPHVTHTHWQQIRADRSVTYLEDGGCVDFYAVAEVMKRRHYQGTISVEYCWQDLDRSRISTAYEFVRKIGLN